jgi:hypothetical protein
VGFFTAGAAYLVLMKASVPASSGAAEEAA